MQLLGRSVAPLLVEFFGLTSVKTSEHLSLSLLSCKEYLEQKFDCGPNLMPKDAAGCAKVRLWNHHLNNKFLSF